MANQLCTFKEAYEAAVRSEEFGSDYHAAIARAMAIPKDAPKEDLLAAMAEVKRLGDLIAGQ